MHLGDGRRGVLGPERGEARDKPPFHDEEPNHLGEKPDAEAQGLAYGHGEAQGEARRRAAREPETRAGPPVGPQRTVCHRG